MTRGTPASTASASRVLGDRPVLGLGRPTSEQVRIQHHWISGHNRLVGGTGLDREGPFENVDYLQFVMSDYFDTMGIPIVAGRGFQPIDGASSGMVAVVNESYVKTFWNGQDPIGQRVRICCGDQVPWFTVIGVAKDVKQGGVDQKTGTELYLFVEQTARVPPPAGLMPGTMNVVLRTTLPPAALAQTIERVVREVDPAVPGWRDVPAVLTGPGEPLEVLADRATTNFFAVLGVPAILGRTFTTDTDLSRVAPEVVLSYGLWQRRYGGERRVVDQPITLDGEVYTIVGVMPRGAVRTNELAESRAELWMPLPVPPRPPGDARRPAGRDEGGMTPYRNDDQARDVRGGSRRAIRDGRTHLDREPLAVALNAPVGE